MASGDDIPMTRPPWLDNFIFYNFLITTFVAPISITWNEIFMGLTFLFWVIKFIVRREKLRVPPLGWLFLIYLLVTILSAGASGYKFQALRGIWDIARYTGTFL